MEEEGMLSTFRQGNLQERELWEDLGVDERAILECILNIQVSIRGNGLIRLKIRIFGEPL